jgi:hypothetical protein
MELSVSRVGRQYRRRSGAQGENQAYRKAADEDCDHEFRFHFRILSQPPGAFFITAGLLGAIARVTSSSNPCHISYSPDFAGLSVKPHRIM